MPTPIKYSPSPPPERTPIPFNYSPSPPPEVRTHSPASVATPPPGAGLPDCISIQVHLHCGAPLTHCHSHASLPAPAVWDYQWDTDSYDVLCGRIRRCISGLQNMKWTIDAHPYLQPTHNSTQQNYLILDEEFCD